MPSDNPILNNPFEEPRFHYATNLKGELDYDQVVSGRRPFIPKPLKHPRRNASRRKSADKVGDARGIQTHEVRAR